jgi:hypothetical protein
MNCEMQISNRHTAEATTKATNPHGTIFRLCDACAEKYKSQANSGVIFEPISNQEAAHESSDNTPVRSEVSRGTGT